MRLRLTEFNHGVCTRTGRHYRWNGERWVRWEKGRRYSYPQLRYEPYPDGGMFHPILRERGKALGLDIEQSYRDFINHLKGNDADVCALPRRERSALPARRHLRALSA